MTAAHPAPSPSGAAERSRGCSSPQANVTRGNRGAPRSRLVTQPALTRQTEARRVGGAMPRARSPELPENTVDGVVLALHVLELMLHLLDGLVGHLR